MKLNNIENALPSHAGVPLVCVNVAGVVNPSLTPASTLVCVNVAGVVNRKHASVDADNITHTSRDAGASGEAT